jgi:hypothetical protein
MASGPSPSASPAPGLLVAVTGEPGAGKTRLLAELAAWHGTRSGRTEGFVAVAGERVGPGAGADAYRLQLLATGDCASRCQTVPVTIWCTDERGLLRVVELDLQGHPALRARRRGRRPGRGRPPLLEECGGARLQA